MVIVDGVSVHLKKKKKSRAKKILGIPTLAGAVVQQHPKNSVFFFTDFEKVPALWKKE